jgi:hypothetical protein
MTPRSLYGQARYLGREEAQALTKRILGFSTAESVRVSVNSGSRGNTRFAVNQVSTAGENYNAAVTIVSSFGKRSGSVTTNRLDDASLREAVQSSEKLARLSPEDPEAMPDLEPQEYAESLGWSDATASLDPASRAGATREISDAARAAGLVATGYAETISGSTAIANSRGLFAYGRQTQLLHHHSAHRGRRRLRVGGNGGPRLGAGGCQAPRDSCHREGEAFGEPRGHRAWALHRGARADCRREPAATAGIRHVGARSGRGSLVLLEAGRRNEARDEGCG